VRVGRCDPGEPLDSCTAGGNAFGDLGCCSDYSCKAGTTIGIQIVCGNIQQSSLVRSTPLYKQSDLSLPPPPIIVCAGLASWVPPPFTPFRSCSSMPPLYAFLYTTATTRHFYLFVLSSSFLTFVLWPPFLPRICTYIYT
jgi:hypothetical protein